MKETSSRADERLLVEEMIRGQRPEHWEEIDKLVRRLVYSKAKNMPFHLLDDIAQDIMFKIMKYLPHFRFQCALKTWVNTIIERHIIDEYRKLRNEGSHLLFSDNTYVEADSESQESNANATFSAEDAFEMNEKIRMGMEGLLEYANTHANSTRNKRIIRMVCFEGQTYEKAAKAVGCHAPVIHYVVREAQRYARAKWDCYR